MLHGTSAVPKVWTGFDGHRATAKLRSQMPGLAFPNFSVQIITAAIEDCHFKPLFVFIYGLTESVQEFVKSLDG